MTKKSIALVQVETTSKQEYIRLDDSSSSLNKSHPGFPIQIETPRVQDERLVSVYFTALGIASLMAWSTLLSTLDYYHAQFPHGEVNFYFPASFTLTSFLIKLLMVWLKETLSLNTRIAAFFGLQAVMLCCLPILAGILSNTALGYWISILFLIILGAISQICNASATGLFGYFPSKYVSNFTTGTGLGGLMSNMLRVITLVFSANTEEKSYLFDMCMQYGVTGVFLIFCIILHYRFMESKYALDQINKYADTVKLAEYTSNELPLLKPRTTPHHMTNIKNGLFRLWVTFKKVPALSLFMILIYIQTLMLFPGVTLKQDIPNLDLSWKITLMMITYNFFDTLGKYVTRRRSLFNKPFIYKLIFSRFIFYFTFIAQAISTNTPILDDVWFTLLNLALFGLTNGFATSALFIFGPEELEGEDKEIVGFLLVNCLSFGIMLGSFLALPFSNL